MNQTAVFTKEQFIEWAKQIPDNCFLVASNGVNGKIDISEGMNYKRVPFIFSASTFHDPRGAADLVSKETPCLALIICKKRHLSKEQQAHMGLINQDNQEPEAPNQLTVEK